jgi:hypothetical protein
VDLSHGPRASGHLHRLIPDPTFPVDVFPNERVLRLTEADSWRFIRERPGARSPRNVGSPPRLTVEAPVLDLCAATTEKEVIGIITTAVERRLTSGKRLAAAMSGRARQRHRRLISDLIADVALGLNHRSRFSYRRNVERPHGLPRGVRQQQRSGLRYRSDVGYDEYGVLVELDGRAGHEGMGRFRDMNRDNRLAMARWMTLRYGWFDVVERPCAVALRRRGVDDSRLARLRESLPQLCELASVIECDPPP